MKTLREILTSDVSLPPFLAKLTLFRYHINASGYFLGQLYIIAFSLCFLVLVLWLKAEAALSGFMQVIFLPLIIVYTILAFTLEMSLLIRRFNDTRNAKKPHGSDFIDHYSHQLDRIYGPGDTHSNTDNSLIRTRHPLIILGLKKPK